MDKLRFGVIGTNWITEHFIHAAKLHPHFVLSAVYSRTEQRAAEFAAKHGAAHTFTSLEEMAASKEVDAVYVASPNSFHCRQATMMMNAGKHVLCEKPIASNAEQLREMIEAANKNEVVLMEAVKSTPLPNFKAIEEGLGKIGTVRKYVANYCQYSSRYDAYKAGTVLNAFNPVFSNGALMDLGLYCLYPLAALFGKPEQIHAAGVMLASGVDGEGSIVMKYKTMDAVAMYSKITNSLLPSEIQGEDGSIVIDQISQPSKVEIHYRDGSTEQLTRPQPMAVMYYELEEFIGCVQSGKLESAINSHARSLLTMEIMDEARQQIGLRYPADE